MDEVNYYTMKSALETLPDTYEWQQIKNWLSENKNTPNQKCIDFKAKTKKLKQDKDSLLDELHNIPSGDYARDDPQQYHRVIDECYEKLRQIQIHTRFLAGNLPIC